MLLVAYLSLFGTIIWLLRRDDDDWIRIRPWLALLIRGVASLLAVLIQVLGAFTLVGAAPDLDALVIAFGAALIGGGFLYFQGVVLWRGKGAYRLRVVGWCLIAAAMSVPSTLTLALPVVAMMAVVLAEVPVTGTRHTVRLIKPSRQRARIGGTMP